MPNEKISILISASLSAVTLAKTLRDDFTTDVSEAFIWSDAGQDQVCGKMLENVADTYDFAVIILIRNDVVLKRLATKEQLTARDNFFIGAGILTGALGRDCCFLISDAKVQELPVDLQGFIYLPLNEAADSADNNQFKLAISDAKTRIMSVIQERGRLIRHKSFFLSFEEVFEKERLKKEGGNLEKGNTVVVCDIRLLENFNNGKSIQKNIKNGINYIYSSQADRYGASNVCSLLKMILLPYDQISLDWRKSYDDICEEIIEYKNPIIQNLKTFRKRLSFLFLPNEPAFYFRIHNAESSKAKMYLRNRSLSFVDWSKMGNGQAVWDFLQRYADPEDPKREKSVFCSSTMFRPHEAGPFRDLLSREIGRNFFGFGKDIEKYCFRI